MSEALAKRQIKVSIAKQTLTLLDGDIPLMSFSVSTALKGTGQAMDSGCTPLGEHRIKIKIGQNCAENTVFSSRRPTGEIYSPQMALEAPDRDWILTRILWLSGTQPGFNRGGDVDTLRRYIYIHGCPDSEPMGQARSHGCIRMRNSELIQLFDQVAEGDLVTISAD